MKVLITCGKLMVLMLFLCAFLVTAKASTGSNIANNYVQLE